jgi:hypothetical protein
VIGISPPLLVIYIEQNLSFSDASSHEVGLLAYCNQGRNNEQGLLPKPAYSIHGEERHHLLITNPNLRCGKGSKFVKSNP